MEQYGCTEFVSVMNGDREIPISYWETEDQILRCKNHPEHLHVQCLGRSRWYDSCDVEVVKVLRKYAFRA